MDKIKQKNRKYILIGKTLFFPKEKVICIGDLHLGYESSLRKRGLEVPLRQFEEVEKEMTQTIEHIRARYGKIEKIIFLGDIKHHFGYIGEEKEEITKLLRFLRKYVDNENKIIFIRGNHEKSEKSEKYVDYYIVKDIIFIHGHMEFLEIFDKKINLVVMGHIHPSIIIEDKMKIKREKYKCFLIGRYRKKDFVILPSFISITEGVSANEFSGNLDGEEAGKEFSIVPEKDLLEFEVYAVNEVGEEALDFGKLGDIG